MQIFSYPGCQTCLVKVCCQCICEEYKQHIYKTRDIKIETENLSLEEAETSIAVGHSKTSTTFTVGDKEYIIEMNVRVDGIVKLIYDD